MTGVRDRWQVAIVGPGRVGTLLAIALTRAGHRVVAVGGGSAEARANLSHAVAGVRGHDRPAAAAAEAELVVLAVPDDQLADLVTELAVDDCLRDRHHVVHVAGSLGLEPLRRAALAGARTAACHPAMTVPTGSADPDLLVGAAWAVTAAAADRAWAHELVTDLGGDPHDVADGDRVLYHAGLAVGSNTVGAAVAVARQLLLGAGITDPAAFLAPLVARSVEHVLADGASALTGPIVRGDVGTIAHHLEVVDEDLPELSAAYRDLSRVLLGRVRAQLPPAAAAELEALLGDGRPDVPS